MTAPWIRDVMVQGLAATRSARMLKAVAIAASLRCRRPGARVHADLSPDFLTMFRDVILESFDHSRIAIIDLRRDPVEVARRLTRRWAALPADQVWGEVALDPIRPDGPLDLEPGSLVGASDRVFAHIGEILHLREALRLEAPTLTWLSLDAESLRTRRGVRQLYASLDLDAGGNHDGLDRLQPWKRSELTTPPRRVRRTPRTRLERELDEFLARTAESPRLGPLRREVARWRR